MTIADTAAAVRIARIGVEERERKDPLSAYVFSSESAEWVAEHVGQAWIYYPAANSTGKSHSTAALAVAVLTGRRTLGVQREGRFWDGKPWRAREVEIPYVPPPVSGAIGTPTYKLGESGSIIDKVREAIGP